MKNEERLFTGKGRPFRNTCDRCDSYQKFYFLGKTLQRNISDWFKRWFLQGRGNQIRVPGKHRVMQRESDTWNSSNKRFFKSECKARGLWGYTFTKYNIFDQFVLLALYPVINLNALINWIGSCTFVTNVVTKAEYFMKQCIIKVTFTEENNAIMPNTSRSIGKCPVKINLDPEVQLEACGPWCRSWPGPIPQPTPHQHPQLLPWAKIF